MFPCISYIFGNQTYILELLVRFWTTKSSGLVCVWNWMCCYCCSWRRSCCVGWWWLRCNYLHNWTLFAFLWFKNKFLTSQMTTIVIRWLTDVSLSFIFFYITLRQFSFFQYGFSSLLILNIFLYANNNISFLLARKAAIDDGLWFLSFGDNVFLNLIFYLYLLFLFLIGKYKV